MKVQFLGVGTAFAKTNYASNVLIQTKQHNYTIDFGYTAARSLLEKGFSLDKIHGVLITHLHADHIGGLEELALVSRLLFKRKPSIITTDSLHRDLWNKSLRGGLEYLEETPGDDTMMKLSDYFELQVVPVDEWYTFPDRPDLTVRFVPNDHILKMESYGIAFKTESGKIWFYTGDTKFRPNYIAPYEKEAEIIFHDCQLTQSGRNNEKGVHASIQQLQTLPEKLRKKLWLYHYDSGENKPTIEGVFAGYVTQHNVFEF